MLRKHLSVFQDDLKYICDDIVNPFHVRIIYYAGRVGYMHNLANQLPPLLMKGESFESDNWKICNNELYVHDIRFEVKDGLPSSMQDDFGDNQEEYRSFTHEYLRELLSTIEVKVLIIPKIILHG